MKNLVKNIKRHLYLILSPGQFIQFWSIRNIQHLPGLPFISLTYFLEILSRRGQPLFFVQIGAYDGQKNDPINDCILKNHWQGILVEPVPEHFTRLVENYKNEPQLIFENAGIAEVEGDLTFYALPSRFKDPDWLQQIGSFDRNSIEFNLKDFPELLGHISERVINAIRLDTLFLKHEVENVDILVIDAEGYEYKILNQLKDITLRPRYIIFEWGTMNQNDLSTLLNLLISLNYKLFSTGDMILAVFQRKK